MLETAAPNFSRKNRDLILFPTCEKKGSMKSVRTMRCWLCPLLLAMLTGAQALTLDVKAVKLNADQHASLNRFLADSLPTLTFDWNSLAAYSTSQGGKRQPLSVSLVTVPTMRPAGVCRSEEHHFTLEAAEGHRESKRTQRWQSNEDLTRFLAWIPQGGACAQESSTIDVDQTLSDTDFLFIDRQKDALRSRAAGVIGGSDCARVRFCEVTLRRISRVRDESPSRASRTLTTLTFSPLQPGPSCLYVMEVSFVGPLNNLEPQGASCPLP